LISEKCISEKKCETLPQQSAAVSGAKYRDALPKNQYSEENKKFMDGIRFEWKKLKKLTFGIDVVEIELEVFSNTQRYQDVENA
jgi:hypothetical protein